MNRLVFTSAIGCAWLFANALPMGNARAQTTLFTSTGSTTSDQLGKSVAGVGDVNNDGWDDYALGIPYADASGADAGSVRVVSGRTGQTMYTFNGLAAGDRLGESVAGAGDLNADGFADILAGAPLHDHNGTSSGMARVWSGRDGSVLYTWYGDQMGDWFGLSVDAAGDANNDGRADVIVGAPYGKGTSTSKIGEARLFSGLNGSVIRTFNAPGGVEALGTSVSGAGDIDQDGWDDVIVGSPQFTSGTQQDTGRAYVFSSKTGAVLWNWTGVSSGQNYATCVDGGLDVNNDGWPDLVVGAPFSDPPGMGNAGTIYVFSGRTGTQLYSFNGVHGADELGRSCGLAGDVDGDGWADIIGGARLNDQLAPDAGMARIWSGRTGQALFSLYGNVVGEFFGHAVARAGDIDADGLDDVIVGWPGADYAGNDSGRARLWTGTPFPATTYCTATTNTAGCQSGITTTGTPSATISTPFTVRATQVLNNKAGLLFYGRHGDATPYLGGFLCVEPPLKRTWAQTSGGSSTGTSCTGTLTIDMNNWVQGQNDLTLGSGDTVFAQFWYRDTASATGVAYSNAVLFTILP